MGHQRSEFYNNYFKNLLEKNDIEMYSTHNEGKPIVAKRFTRTLKTEISECMTSISKNVYIDKLNNIVNEYNNTYHRTIKMKPVYVKDNTYINYSKEVNDKDPNFQFADHVRISKYKNKNIFAKRHTPNWSEEVFMIKQVKYSSMDICYFDLNGQGIIGKFYEKELQKTNRIEKKKNRKRN